MTWSDFIIVLTAKLLRSMWGRFLHGVASGEPSNHAIVLWTRLTPTKDAKDAEVPVRWQIWDGNNLLLSGEEKAKEMHDFTVKVHVHSELFQPSVLYTYGFDCGACGAKSPFGQFRLPPAPSQPLHSLDYAIFSCANRGFGNFRAYSEAVDRSPQGLDFWLHLGDYIYEYGRQYYPEPSETRVPGLQPANDVVHLQEYRKRYAFYRLDPDLQRLSAAAPMISIWDDHEVANDDWMHGAENHQSDQGNFEARKAAAIRAYHEWLPTPNWDLNNATAAPWMRWRRFDFGRLATLLMLETRLWARTSQAEMTTETVYQDILGTPQYDFGAVLAGLRCCGGRAFRRIIHPCEIPLDEYRRDVPPGWRPGQLDYPLKLYLERVRMWYDIYESPDEYVGPLLAGRLRGRAQQIALTLRLPDPHGGTDIGDSALVRLSVDEVRDPVRPSDPTCDS
eukprot:s1176_g6.t1